MSAGAPFALPWLNGAYRLGRAAGPPPEPLDPERIATLLRVPPWICANVDGSSWGPLRRLAWRVRYWTWRP